MNRNYLLFALLHISLMTWGQEPVFVHYTAADGLPSNTVYSIVQDHEGYIWMATETGVTRFDGIKITNYTPKDGLPSSEILKLFVDSRGIIWMVCYSGEVAFYRDHQFYNRKNTPWLNELKLKQWPNVLLEDSKGNIWISAFASPTYCIDPASGFRIKKRDFSRSRLGHSEIIFEHDNGQLYMYSDSVLSTIDENFSVKSQRILQLPGIAFSLNTHSGSTVLYYRSNIVEIDPAFRKALCYLNGY